HAVAAHDGYVFATGGDGFAVAFPRADDAVRAAVDAQAALLAEAWPPAAELRVRMGIHTGDAAQRDGDYFGPAVNRAARVMAVAHGGQLVGSATTADIVSDHPGMPLRDLGEHRLRDLLASQRIYQVGDGRFPPLRTVDSVPSNLPTVLTDLIGR